LTSVVCIDGKSPSAHFEAFASASVEPEPFASMTFPISALRTLRAIPILTPSTSASESASKIVPAQFALSVSPMGVIIF
jgi:hypothetical protein